MREMKHSGIEWIGEIPADWNIKRVKAVLCERNESNNPIQTDKILSLTNDRGVIPYEEKGDVGNKSKEDLTGYKLAYPGDIVLNSMNVFIGSVGLSSYFGCVSPVYYMLYPRNKKDSVSFFNYLFQTKELQSKLHGYGNGIMEIRMRIQMSKLNSVQLPIPPSDVQHKIAAYLDRKCSQIDAIVARQQEVIEKLKNYKLSVITEAVTKGLNPDVPMKDSGVEWIGEIPEHWDILKLQAHTRMLTPMRDRPEKLDGDIPWVRIEDYDGKYISASKEGLGVSTETVKEMNLKIYPVGSILCTSSCDLGKCAIVTRELVSNQRFINITPDSNTNSDYLYYLMISNAERLNHLSTGTIQANLSRKAFEHLMVQFPPISEQKAISEYLDRKCEAVELSINKKQELIDRLSSYKKSLIYEVVTGKKEV